MVNASLAVRKDVICMVNKSERGITNASVAEQLFRQGNVTLSEKGGDIFFACRVDEGSRSPFRISGEQEQNGQMIEVVGSSGLTQSDALSALPYRFRKSIVDVFQKNEAK